jgi:hypothetical protein
MPQAEIITPSALYEVVLRLCSNLIIMEMRLYAIWFKVRPSEVEPSDTLSAKLL